jgi:hypothetical protein
VKYVPPQFCCPEIVSCPKGLNRPSPSLCAELLLLLLLPLCACRTMTSRTWRLTGMTCMCAVLRQSARARLIQTAPQCHQGQLQGLAATGHQAAHTPHPAGPCMRPHLHHPATWHHHHHPLWLATPWPWRPHPLQHPRPLLCPCMRRHPRRRCPLHPLRPRPCHQQVGVQAGPLGVQPPPLVSRGHSRVLLRTTVSLLTMTSAGTRTSSTGMTAVWMHARPTSLTLTAASPCGDAPPAVMDHSGFGGFGGWRGQGGREGGQLNLAERSQDQSGSGGCLL